MTFISLIRNPNFQDYEETYQFCETNGLIPHERLCTPEHIGLISKDRYSQPMWWLSYYGYTPEGSRSYGFEASNFLVGRPSEESSPSSQELTFLRIEFWKRYQVDFYERLLVFIRRSSSELDLPVLAPKVLASLEIPNDFKSSKDYLRLEPDDKVGLACLKAFPSATPAIDQAKKFWLGELEAEDMKALQANPTPEVNHFRKLLWKRHFDLDRSRKGKENFKRQSDLIKRRDRLIERRESVTTAWCVMMWAAGFFVAMTVLSQSLIFLIPAAIFLGGAFALYYVYPHLSEYFYSPTIKDVDFSNKCPAEPEIPCLEEIELKRLDRYLEEAQQIRIEEIEEDESSSAEDTSEKKSI